MALLGTLQVRLGLETGVFSKGMARFAKDAKGQTAGISKAFANLVPTKSILAGLGSLATAATAVSFAKMIQGANNLTDTLRDSSIRLGIGIGDLQAFQLAAGNAGIESGKLTDLLGKLNKASGEIKLGAGNEKTVEAFRSIGIGIAEIQRSNPAQLFERVIGGLGGIQDPAARAATAMAIFGRSGQAALTLVADGTGSLKESRKLLDDLGLSLTKINADNVDAANDALGSLGFVATAAKQKIGAELAPAIADLTKKLIEAGKGADNLGSKIEFAVGVVVGAFSTMASIVQGIGDVFGAQFRLITTAFTTLGAGVLSFASTFVTAIGTDAPNALNGFIQAAETGLTNLKQGFIDFAESAANVVVDGMNKAIEAIDGLVNAAAKQIEEFINLANKIPGIKLGTFSYSQTSGKIDPISLGAADPVKIGQVPTFGEGLAADLANRSQTFGINGDGANAGTGAAAGIASNAADMAKSLKEATAYSNELTGALGGTGAAGGGGGSGSGGGVAGALQKSSGAVKALEVDFKDLVEGFKVDGIVPKLKDWIDALKLTGLEVGNVWTDSMQTIGSAIDEFVKTGKLNFKDLGNSILQSIASAAIKNAINSLFGAVTGGSSGSTGNLVGSVLKLFGTGTTSFEGGGYTGSGPRTGGMDGRGGRLAMLHPNETVIDHEKVRAGARSRRRGDGVNLTVPITLMPGVSKQELAEILPLVKRDIISTIPALISRGGRYAAAYGQ